MKNSVFGKTMENLRKRVGVRLVSDQNKLAKLVSKPTFIGSKIFNDRSAYVRMCILDLFKRAMYDFHYNYIKLKYGEKAKLLFPDTDSLCYEIESKDAYKDFRVG